MKDVIITNIGLTIIPMTFYFDETIASICLRCIDRKITYIIYEKLCFLTHSSGNITESGNKLHFIMRA